MWGIFDSFGGYLHFLDLSGQKVVGFNLKSFKFLKVTLCFFSRPLVASSIFHFDTIGEPFAS